MTLAGALLLAIGAAMYARGLIYTLRPTGRIAEKRKRKNLKYGMPTDMSLFGRRLRRLAFLVALAGAWLVAWQLSGDVGAAAPLVERTA